MQLFTQVNAPYQPEPEQTSVLRLGIAPLAIADWLQPDADFAQFHAHKSHVLRSSADQVCLTLNESGDIQQTFASFLLQNLREHHGEIYRIDDGELIHLPTGLHWPTEATTLAQSSRWIQEDICLLEPSGDCYIMTAASVCSPSNWKLEEKIGKSLDAIHDPVPGYQQVLAARVNRLLVGIKAGKPLMRFNWSLQNGNELLWRPDHEPNTPPSELFWRVERQSLLRIPYTRIIVFSIRIYLHSVARLEHIPAFRANLRNILAQLPAEQKRYKGLIDKPLT